MIVADKNLVVLPEMCSDCDDCFRVECLLCRPCFTDEMKVTLEQTYWEHHNKMDYLRIFPPPIVSLHKKTLTVKFKLNILNFLLL